MPTVCALDLSPTPIRPPVVPPAFRVQRAAEPAAPTAAERVLAAELQARGEANDALSMMVSSVARMVQAGRSSDSRWKASA